jgi:hypothetical protein
MASRWLKTNCLAASTAAFWLTALSPIPPIGKGISYSLAIVASVQLVQESKRLIADDARRVALLMMNRELEDVEIALHTTQQEQALYEVYGASNPAYPPEVQQELTQSLEHLYKEPSANHPEELQASTSQKKSLYLAVKSLLEVKGETYVIEQVLRLGGGQWTKGKQVLQQILEEGEGNGW